MGLSFTCGRKTLAVILLSVMLLICLVSRFSDTVNAGSDGGSVPERIAFLKSIGCEVNAESESSKRIVIPSVFSQVYERYNGIQKRAGYDLSLYKGCECEVYSYDVVGLSSGEDPQYYKANLIVYRGRIIGGDISSVELDGNMYPLLKQNEKTKT